MKEITEPEMLHRAAAYCSAAERCIQDVQKKIDAAGLPPEASERIIARLQKERFIDESRYTRFFVNDKLRFNKWGRVKIGYELYKKNIPSPIREESLAAIDEGEYRTILLDLLKSKKKSTKGKNERDTFNKLLRFAAGRGSKAGSRWIASANYSKEQTARIMPTIWNNLLNLFFPNLCKICKRPLVEGEEQICLKCLCDLPHTGYHQQANNPVEQLFIGKNRIEYATAYLRYEKGGKVQSLIHSLKYHDNKELGYLLGRQIARELQADHSPICTVDLLIPVPLHPRKKRQRGYNQSEWIASGIRSVWDIPIDTQSLARTTHTNTQTHKAIYDRWLNVCSIFNVIYPESLKNKHILLIDDVITTGATISACAKALSGIPGIRISILALSIA